ncbi:thiamine ABC transporter substrate-binding protein [Streptomyces iconiensis]|uniref:Thiamine ABC transporter substrate-binding protein n=1 Tax=Streptomyces iconiensis TaxID=1384038 RepID=A0ABT6ZU42_9ACTN|nr:thiamine ABC transporter substrate-binding protein [Streptomyces iconiensis]MDJ1132574.1 thiamine ABC transporter substrate-binding protein [Streptomyces iconiensis]
MNKHAQRAAAATTAVLALALVATACGGSGGDGDPKTVTLVTHDSFAASKPVLKDFTERTGYKVKVLRGGDAGATVNQAVLNKGNPQGDVLFGVDNTLLSRPLEEGVFAPYEAKGLSAVPKGLQADPDKHRVTPVDTGDVCVNYDRKWFADKKLAPPRSLADLVKPRYKNLLVTQNAANSSPGLSFLLATVGTYGEKGWQGYWKKLRANGVEVVDSWEQAYNDRFSGSRGGKGKGDRPLVVSYASSPPVEVMGAKPEPEQAPTGIAKETCFRQTEYAGLLDGAKNTKGGKALLDFLLSKKFQEDLPLQMFVNPAREDAELPKLFTKYGETIDDPATVAPQKIAKNREQWIKTWTSLTVK